MASSCYSGRCCSFTIGLLCIAFFVGFSIWFVYAVKTRPDQPYFPFLLLLAGHVFGATLFISFALCLPPGDNYNDSQEIEAQRDVPEDRPLNDNMEMNASNPEQQGLFRQVQANVPEVNPASGSIQERPQTQSAAHGTDQSDSGDGNVPNPGQSGQSQKVRAKVNATNSAAAVCMSTGGQSDSDQVPDLSENKKVA